MLEFLCDVEKHLIVNNLIGKEAISRRLESEEGISFTEFSYPLLQAYDYLVLYDRYKCTCKWVAATSGATFWQASIWPHCKRRD